MFDGVDVKRLDLGYLRKNVGVVSQETYLFNGTIRDNLLYAKPNASEEEMIEACRKANILDFIESQEKGLDTMVGNRGLKLSGGEKQRISIARVLLKDPALLIFDEATSALDNKTQRQVSEALDRMGCTRLVIAHRLSTIRHCGRILVLDGGRIAEDGTYEELIERGGLFAELVERQRLE